MFPRSPNIDPCRLHWFLVPIILLLLPPALCHASQAPGPQSTAMKVVFISPGHAHHDNPTGHFWPESSSFAQAVADDLGIHLEILHANRDSFRMRSLVLEVIARPEKPDYLLLVNERFALTPLFVEINSAAIPFFLAYNHHSKQTNQPMPEPRSYHEYWLGALLPDNEYAGYQLAKLLIEQSNSRRAKLLAYSGDTVTSASLLRQQGLQRALANHPSAQLVRLLPGEWRYDIPQRKTPGILRRHPEINAIWAANGPMALGALQGASTLDNPPAVEAASINWDSNEIEALQRGELYASVGGHFMTAGWSLIMLYDYHHGRDFISDGGSYQQRQIFEAVTRDTIENYLPILKDRDWGRLNYKKMTKTLNPERDEYHFTLGELLR